MPKKRAVLFVDDDANYLDSMARNFHKWDIVTIFENSAEAALLRMESTDVDVIVVDNMMPGIGGIALVGEVAKIFPGVVCIVISGALTVDQLILAINQGHVYKVLTKPCKFTEVQSTIISALKYKVELENRYRFTSMDDYAPMDL